MIIIVRPPMQPGLAQPASTIGFSYPGPEVVQSSTPWHVIAATKTRVEN